MNLLKETRHCIEQAGYVPEEIIFIGSIDSGHSCTWDEFCILANHDYDNGPGTQVVATDLIIVFKDNVQMWRFESDGTECWEWRSMFKAPIDRKRINNLFGTHLRIDTLAEINNGEEL